MSLFIAQQRDLPLNFEAAGTIVPLNTVELRPQLTATVRSVAVQEGQLVKAGELLFTFDDRAEQANLAKARATVLRDQATLADLQRQWQRAQDLQAQNFIAQSAADGVLSQLEAQRALLAADEAALKSAQVAASFGQLRSPLAGRVGAIAVHPGSLVQPAGAVLATVSQVHPIGVAFNLPEARLPALLANAMAIQASKAGVAKTAAGLPQPLALMVAAAGSPNSAGNRAGPVGQNGLAGDKPAAKRAPAAIEGRLSFINNTVDTATGTVLLKGELPNQAQNLWPGQYVTVKMTLATLKDATVLPQAALILRGQDRQVYVVDAQSLAELRPVKLLQSAGEWAAVEGVAPGEKVVLDGKQNLRPGTPVKESTAKDALKEPSKPASEPASTPSSEPQR